MAKNWEEDDKTKPQIKISRYVDVWLQKCDNADADNAHNFISSLGLGMGGLVLGTSKPHIWARIFWHDFHKFVLPSPWK